MPIGRRGEVWQVDLGLVAKVRPAVVLSVPFLDDERAVFEIVPHTTAFPVHSPVVGPPWKK